MSLRRLYSTGAISVKSPTEAQHDVFFATTPVVTRTNTNTHNNNITRQTSAIAAVPAPIPQEQEESEEPETAAGLWREIKTYPKITAFCVGLMFSSLIGGYDTAISGNIIALPRFQRDFGVLYDDSWIIPSLWLSMWNVASALGLMAGALTGGWLEDRCGRRISLLTGTINSAMALALNYCPNLLDNMESRRGAYLVGRVLQGIALGIMGSTSQTFMSEITPPGLQGPAMALLPFGELLGELLGGAVVITGVDNDSPRSYLNPIASQWAFLAIPLLVIFFIPESPAWLVRVKRSTSLTKAALTRLHTSKVDVTRIQSALETILAYGELETDDGAVSYLDCFRGVNRRRTWIVILTSCIPVIFGVPLLAQSSYFAQTYGMDPDLSLLLLIIGIVVGLLANATGIFILSKIGRRKLVICSLAISSVLWTGMGIAGFWSGQPTIWYGAVTMILVVLFNGLGAWPASYAVSSEASTLRLRARSQGIGWFSYSFANGVMSMTLPYIYNPDAGALRGKTGLVLAGSCVIGLVLSWFLVPEMKDRTPAEVDEMFELRLKTRAFKSWVAGDEPERSGKAVDVQGKGEEMGWASSAETAAETIDETAAESEVKDENKEVEVR